MISLQERGVRVIDGPDWWPDDGLPSIDKVRIWREDFGVNDPTPWHLDGYVMTVHDGHPAAVLSPGVWDFYTHADAVAAIPKFIALKGADL